MLVNYDFITRHDTQIYYENMCGSFTVRSESLFSPNLKLMKPKQIKNFAFSGDKANERVSVVKRKTSPRHYHSKSLLMSRT